MKDAKLLAWEWFVTETLRKVYLKRGDFAMVNECERTLHVLRLRWEKLKEEEKEEVLH